MAFLFHSLLTAFIVCSGGLWWGVVWCGVVWCGVVWCGVVWCGVVLCGTLFLFSFSYGLFFIFLFILSYTYILILLQCLVSPCNVTDMHCFDMQCTGHAMHWTCNALDMQCTYTHPRADGVEEGRGLRLE